MADEVAQEAANFLAYLSSKLISEAAFKSGDLNAQSSIIQSYQQAGDTACFS